MNAVEKCLATKSIFSFLLWLKSWIENYNFNDMQIELNTERIRHFSWKIMSKNICKGSICADFEHIRAKIPFMISHLISHVSIQTENIIAPICIQQQINEK